MATNLTFVLDGTSVLRHLVTITLQRVNGEEEEEEEEERRGDRMIAAELFLVADNANGHNGVILEPRITTIIIEGT